MKKVTIALLTAINLIVIAFAKDSNDKPRAEKQVSKETKQALERLEKRVAKEDMSKIPTGKTDGETVR